MLGPILNVSILDGWLLYSCYAIALVVVIALLLGSAGRRVRGGRWWLRLLIGAAVGAALGALIGWIFSDIWDPFGVSLTLSVRIWLSLTLAGLGLAIGNLWDTRWWSKVVAVVAVPVLVLVGAMGINAGVGEFGTLSAALGQVSTRPLTVPATSASVDSAEPVWQSWSPPVGMPAAGRAGTVTIPGTVSHFTARQAIVYLPPAALVATPPPLPVLIVLSGQPGQPSDIVTKARFVASLNAFAHAHSGLAPITVIPDQLGSSWANPMCVDSSLGNSETYLTVDVPRWITDHLGVLRNRNFWAIAGFSQGGTCSLQLGAGHPELFGSILDVSGELVPSNGSMRHTVQAGFGGSIARYEAAMPLRVLTSTGPYADTRAIFAVGQDDSRYAPYQVTVAAAATAAGMKVTTLEIPGTAHDWYCATAALRKGLTLLGSRLGLTAP